ncbi:glucokinase [Temperatibacter marinus]|uniref:Glucokinase n=1 Tax=Temperatibacter marinus TaxID=1456591 RepID=A0AA52EJ31_9PROT|nr:glucokinase [Temperatibacter marinus]WND04083.1 glucokinase [Temperatibacter marinus]
MTDVQTIIAADIGGTHARLGYIHAFPNRDARTDSMIELKAYTKYRCADYAAISDVLNEFVKSQNIDRIDQAAIACAGYFVDEKLKATNLPWTFSLDEVRATLNTKNVFGLNDYEALAYSTTCLAETDIQSLNSQGVSVPGKARFILGPGTGLGASVLISRGQALTTLTTEAGNAGFAPVTQVEREIQTLLAKKFDFVSIEHLLSGPGLVNIYQALAEIMDQKALLERPSMISRAALDGSSPLAQASLDVFCEVLGSVTANLVLTYGAQGGAYLAGGILPKFKDYLVNSKFMDRYLANASMRTYLEKVPVNLIEHGNLGVVGAARWCLRSSEANT